MRQSVSPTYLSSNVQSCIQGSRHPRLPCNAVTQLGHKFLDCGGDLDSCGGPGELSGRDHPSLLSTLGPAGLRHADCQRLDDLGGGRLDGVVLALDLDRGDVLLGELGLDLLSRNL